MSDIADLSVTTIARTDQLNADMLVDAPMNIRITAVIVKPADKQQPVAVEYVGMEGRPYKPSLSMRRVLCGVWGKDGSGYAGRVLTLYRDPSVRNPDGEVVGGIKISAASHIQRDTPVVIPVRRGKKAPHMVKRHAEWVATEAAAKLGTTALRTAWTTHRAALGGGQCPDELKQVAAAADAAGAAPITTNET